MLLKRYAFLAVTGLFILSYGGREKVFRNFSVSHPIPINAGVRIIDVEPRKIGGVTTKSIPVHSEFVCIDHVAKSGQIGATRLEAGDFFGGKWTRLLSLLIPEGEAHSGGVAREKNHIVMGSVPLLEVEGRSSHDIHYLNNPFSEKVADWAFSDINQNTVHCDVLIGCQGRPTICNLYPRALLFIEVVLKITPFETGDNRVGDSEWNSDHFEKRLPALKGLIPGLIGLFAICWGWWNLRWERRLPLSGIVFMVGCLLWGYACLVLLSYCADFGS